LEDGDIIKLYQSGKQEEAFAEIMKSYSERLYWYVRRYTCSHEETDDVLQEVFIKVWSALPSFRGEARLFTWIYRIATNEALNWNRRARLRSILSFEAFDKRLENIIDDDTHFCGDELQRELQKAVNTLPDRQKEVFLLRYFEEMPYEEMSEVLDTSVGALKASYHHAHNKIVEYLKKRF